MKQIQVFGDSHARYFEVNDKLVFHAPWIKNIDVDVYKIPASTIIGLGKKRSKLDVKTLINEKIDNNKINIFAFGQVDLELGYFYRKVIKNEEINYGTFVDYLLEQYVEFLKLTNLDKSSMVVKGLNLTVLKYGDFATSYIQRIITENIENKNEIVQAKQKLNTIMESYSARNNATLNFNNKLKKVCLDEGWKYFDINDYLSDFTPGKGILDRFIPSGFDHHLCDSLEVRKMHLSELSKIQREM